MDININPVSGNTTQPYSATVAKNTSAAAPSGPQVAPVHSTASNANASNTADTGEAASRESVLPFKDTYAVSDHQFSIFKDATGKYITRYVSLRDGKITYSPEPTLVKPIQPAVAQASPRIAISA